MSDMEMFCDMLNRAGVRYERKHAGNFYADEEGTVTAVELTAQRGAVNGYSGLTATFAFDKQTGELSNVYIWE